jgi:hypothetical protein
MTTLANALLVIFPSSHFRPLRVLIFSPHARGLRNNIDTTTRIEDPAEGRRINSSLTICTVQGNANQEYSWRCEPNILAGLPHKYQPSHLSIARTLDFLLKASTTENTLQYLQR